MRKYGQLPVERMICSSQVSLRLENYKYGKPIDITKKVNGYSDLKNPSVSIDMIYIYIYIYIYIENVFVTHYRCCEDIDLSLDSLLADLEEGNTIFWIIKLLDFIFDSTTSFLFFFMKSKYSKKQTVKYSN